MIYHSKIVRLFSSFSSNKCMLDLTTIAATMQVELMISFMYILK